MSNVDTVHPQLSDNTNLLLEEEDKLQGRLTENLERSQQVCGHSLFSKFGMVLLSSTSPSSQT